MNVDSPTRRRLLELVYDLLPPAEAAELRRRIDAEPELARAYEEARTTAGLFAEASRLPAEKLQLKRPEETMSTPTEPARPKLPTKPAAATDKRRRRGTWWAVGLAAAAVLMVTVSAGLYWSDWRQRSAIAAGHMRLQVTGPAVLQAAMPTAYTVRTTTVDGDPMPALVEVSLRTPQGEQLFSHSEVTDEQGRLKLTLATKSALSEQAVLHVVAKREDTGDTEKIETRLKVDPVTYAAHLSLDKPLYRPGETVYYRSLVLSRFGLAADRETILEFEILDPGGAVVADSKHEGVTEHGVGSGAFEIPAAAPGGEYTLVARSLGDSFLEQSRPFFVRSYRLPRLKKELEFARDSYAPGDEVVADFLAERAEGGAVAGARLEIVATVDGGEVFREPARADNTGAYQVKFTLPEEIARGDGQLNVIVDDGGTLESAVETIPINLGKVEVEFYPEGGDLAAALENRVYFVARDPLGEPVHVKGLVVNGQGTAVALAETTHEGMGSLGFTPLADETYRLRITSPAGVTNRPELPKVSTQQKVVLTTGTGVFGASDPLTFNVRSAESGLPLVVSAWCRGAQVGQQTLVTTVDGNGANANTVKIPLPDDVGGVIRLTVHDYSEQPPKPVAERLVYRRMARQLKVRAAEISERYSPGDPVNVSLMVTNEKDEPVPAVIGVAVVDDALLNLADDDTAAMNTHFLLTSEVENPEDLEDADFYLSGNRATGSNDDSAVALDLLLGTQGWRRFVEKTLRELEQDEQADEQRLTRLAAITPANPPLMYDNLETIRSKYEESLSDYQGRREGILNALITVGFVVGLGLVLLVVMLGLLKVVSGVRLWVPAVGVTVCCAIIGVILIEPAWRGSDAELVVAFKQFDMAPPEISPETSEAATEEEWDEKGGDWGLDGDEAAGAEMPIDMLEDMPGEDMPAADGELALPGAAPMPGKPDAEGERLAELGEKRKAERGGRLMMEREKGRERFLRVIDGKDLKQLGDLRKQLADLKFDADMDKDFRKELNEALERHRFVVREYAHRHEYLADEPDTRVDFAETLYWHPSLVADNNGMARISFELSDSVTMFRLQADAHGQQRIGSGGGEIVSKIPFSLEPKLPLEVTAGDRIDLPLAVANDTREPMPVEVTFEHGDLVSLDTAAGNDNEPQRKLELPAGGRAREYFVLNVTGRKGDCELTFRGTAQGAGGNLTDAIRRPLVVVPPGFPKTTSYSGQIDGPQELVVSLPEQIVEGSLEVTLNAFPSTLADLQKGMEGMLREPCGCFEQASTSNYPNVLSLQYMQDHDVANPAVTRRAKELLESGYVKLTGYECRQAKEGYEWFGSDPGHEALTAYGLMEFRDMAKVYDVDPKMIERTAEWLLKRRDGKGGFQRNSKALDSFGGAPKDVTDAYITWALSESGQEGIDAEVEHVIKLAEDSEDPYVIALAAAVTVNAGDKDQAKKLLEKLADAQDDDGHLEGTNGSITRSGGLSLKMETTALAALAWLKMPAYATQANRAVEWIVGNRQGSGGFGSTQATILALKALIEHSKANRKTVSGGTLIIQRDGQQIGEHAFAAGQQETIGIDGLEASLRSGENKLTVNLTGDNKLPYALEVAYRSEKPDSHADCAVRLTTKLAADRVAAGETVELAAELSNTSKDEHQPMTVAILGLPAGLEVRPDQLEELKKAGTIDYYETRAREVICYWRSLEKGKTIAWKLDLVAAVPGKYTGPASRAYLYYTSEQKQWVDPLQVEITRE